MQIAQSVEDGAVLGFQAADAVTEPAVELALLGSTELAEDLLGGGEEVVHITGADLSADPLGPVRGLAERYASVDAVFQEAGPGCDPGIAGRADRDAGADDRKGLAIGDFVPQSVDVGMSSYWRVREYYRTWNSPLSDLTLASARALWVPGAPSRPSKSQKRLQVGTATTGVGLSAYRQKKVPPEEGAKRKEKRTSPPAASGLRPKPELSAESVDREFCPMTGPPNGEEVPGRSAKRFPVELSFLAPRRTSPQPPPIPRLDIVVCSAATTKVSTS